MTYFATLKKNFSYTDAKKKFSGIGIKILKYYSQLNTLKVESNKEIFLKDFPFLESLEKEKDDFSV